ncbi:MAG TPA: helix-turn-helix domain-containing protein [Phycisphaerae bacterium]|nr:helix-turn-helix domain-containing protein [Phycisphaerae bacterium]
MDTPAQLAYCMDRLLTVRELAERLRIPVGTIRHWVLTRYVPFVKLGRRIYFDGVVVNDWIQRRAHPGRKAREVV